MGSNSLESEKRRLRAAMRRRREDTSSEEVAAASRDVADRVAELPVWREARTVHTYIGALPGEVATDLLIERAFAETKRVLVPVADMDSRTMRHVAITELGSLWRTAWGGWEPVSGEDVESDRIDLVVVPGVAYDRSGRRLGMGGGFYDRLLGEISVPKVGLAHAWQIVDHVPADALDQRVDAIASPTEFIVVPGGALDSTISR